MINEMYLTSEFQCSPFTDFLGTCTDELQIIFSIVLCVWTIFWGIPLALRAIARCFALIRYRWSTQMDGYDAVEKGIGYYGNEKDGPSRPQTNRLRKPRPDSKQAQYLQAKSKTIASSTVDEYFSVKTRLAHFRFPSPSHPLTPRTLSASLPLTPKRKHCHSVARTAGVAFGPYAQADVSAYDSSASGAMFAHPALPDSPTIPPSLFACSAREAGF